MDDALQLYVNVAQLACVQILTEYSRKGHLTFAEKQRALEFVVALGKSFLRKSANSIER